MTMPNEDLKETEVKDEKSLTEEGKKEAPKLSIRSQFRTAKSRTRFITRVAMFTALSTVFYIWLAFPFTPPFPSFLKVNFSNLFIILGSLLTGPIGGTLICVIRFLLKLVLQPTSTMYVGELTDLLLSMCIMLPASIMYTYKHTKMGGFIGICLSFLSWVLFSMVINWTISLPFYCKMWSVEGVMGALSAVIDGVTEENMMRLYLLYAVLPFNALVGFVNCGVCFIVYKKISQLLKKLGI